MLSRLFTRALSSAWLAYLMIFALQLKLVWGMWIYKDLTTGDTSSYLGMAKGWAANGMGSIAWSPLYTLYYSLFLHFTRDLYVVTMAHRLVIVLALPLLILMLLRRLLHPWIAWGMAARWCVLPINFDALYEVHLFALIPILCAWLLVGIPGSRGRGLCSGMLLVSAVLMRNELSIAFLLFAAACAYAELSESRARGGKGSFPVASYAVPILLAGILISVFYWRATEKGASLQATLDRKHTLNICQVYAVGYQQRHPEWTKSPWTECQGLMQTTFGVPEPSFRDAFFRNPKAMVEHVLWNTSLTPSGLQVLLFNAMSGTVNPDYAPVLRVPRRTAFYSILVIGLFLAAVIKAKRQWATFYPERIRPHLWTWIAMFSVAAVTPAVIATQRPRPSYLFALSVLLLSLIGISLEIVIGSRLLKKFAWAWPLFAVAILLAYRPYYKPMPNGDDRPLLRLYRNLSPFEKKFGPGAVAVTPGYGGELCNYFIEAGKPPCNALYYYGWGPIGSETALRTLLSENQVQLFYVNPAMLREPPVAAFVGHAADLGWSQVGGGPEADSRWLLLEHMVR